MKPRIFIGSSVEGLSVAYSIQANLIHDCEATVWSQGVFELSKTTIESLMDLLVTVDFAIFVFTPDDLTKIRDTTDYAVRDNVLFEYGLFLGKLGRERVYFVVPSDHPIHLPTDLLGITPAKYESIRDDKNLIASTGPASHQIRLSIQKYGSIQILEEESTVPENISAKEENEPDWLQDFLEKKHGSAIEKLNYLIETSTDRLTIIKFEAWKVICEYRLDEKKFDIFRDFILKYPDESYAYLLIGNMLYIENFLDKAIEIVNEAQEKFGNSTELIKLLATCQLKNGDFEAAQKTFESELTYTDPAAACQYASIFSDEKDYKKAREILHKAYINFPQNQMICTAYASVAMELSEYSISLLFYDKLARLEPLDYSHLGYIGNACLSLNLHDYALKSYQKASEMENDSQSWIISNIGNILRNRGFYTESIKYLKKSLELNESSDYTHDRLAGAIKNKDEEEVKYKNFIKEGQKKLKEYGSSQVLNNFETIAIAASEVK